MIAPPAKMISSSSRPATTHFLYAVNNREIHICYPFRKAIIGNAAPSSHAGWRQHSAEAEQRSRFSEPDRVENIRRVTEVSKLFVDARLAVIVSFISPYRAEREILRSRFQSGEFPEIFLFTPLQECERPVPKGPHAKARLGKWADFTDIDAKNEAPKAPDIRLETVARKAEECLDRILLALDPRSLLLARDNRGAR
jgi:hypothetical protein